jgi:hypothetical protein
VRLRLASIQPARRRWRQGGGFTGFSPPAVLKTPSEVLDGEHPASSPLLSSCLSHAVLAGAVRTNRRAGSRSRSRSPPPRPGTCV